MHGLPSGRRRRAKVRIGAPITDHERALYRRRADLSRKRMAVGLTAAEDAERDAIAAETFAMRMQRLGR